MHLRVHKHLSMCQWDARVVSRLSLPDTRQISLQPRQRLANYIARGSPYSKPSTATVDLALVLPRTSQPTSNREWGRPRKRCAPTPPRVWRHLYILETHVSKRDQGGARELSKEAQDLPTSTHTWPSGGPPRRPKLHRSPLQARWPHIRLTCILSSERRDPAGGTTRYRRFISQPHRVPSRSRGQPLPALPILSCCVSARKAMAFSTGSNVDD